MKTAPKPEEPIQKAFPITEKPCFMRFSGVIGVPPGLLHKGSRNQVFPRCFLFAFFVKKEKTPYFHLIFQNSVASSMQNAMGDP
jgi:hypothetical protein